MNSLGRLLLAGFACTLAAAALPLPAAAAWPPDATIPNGFGVQLKNFNDNTQNLDDVQKLGVKWVRRGFGWEAVEKTPGVFDFKEYDRLVADCKARGLSILGCIALGNKLYGPQWLPPAQEAYARYAAALAAHFKDADIVWEIWNEPNTMTFWKHPPRGNTESYAEEYTQLVKLAAPAIHKANPKAIVLGGSVSGMWTESYKWMNFCFAKGILKSGIDVWSVHPYTPRNPEEYIDSYAKMREQMKANGGPDNLPLVNSERGFTTASKGEGATGGMEGQKFEYQAWHLVRQYLVDNYLGTKVTIWYEWNNRNEGFSLMLAGQPTPAYKACANLIAQLKGYRVEKRIEVGSPRDFVLRYAHPDGSIKLVAWTSPPPDQSPDKIVNHSVKIPVEVNGPLALGDLYGAQPSTVNAQGGSVELTLTGAPQYITVKATRK